MDCANLMADRPFRLNKHLQALSLSSFDHTMEEQLVVSEAQAPPVKKMKPARKQVMPGQIEKKEAPQTGKEYSEDHYTLASPRHLVAEYLPLIKIYGTISGLEVTERTVIPSTLLRWGHNLFERGLTPSSARRRRQRGVTFARTRDTHAQTRLVQNTAVSSLHADSVRTGMLWLHLWLPKARKLIQNM